MNNETAKKIRQRIYGHGRGWVFIAKDFLDIASHENARKILSRLTTAGTIRRLMHGVYDYPRPSTLFDAPAAPDPYAIARAIARAHGWTIMPTGDTAANILGLSTQIPARYQYLSDGPTKHYEWDNGTLTFKHRTNKETTKLSGGTALLVQALKNIGESQIDNAVKNKIMAKLTPGEIKIALREAKYSTAWVYEIIKELDVKRRDVCIE
ncbi:MAG: DUF6088 family protein [Dehalogenimonas sp.]|uniref:DUF6088 family protein n=1 Tax=Candidatus Dehalogenimonas loeffleri TaxID=3127115 RepID=A0ABZ2J3A6_9CHLR|nr:DUF6088 family protein [Dehalogenimonas sp.]